MRALVLVTVALAIKQWLCLADVVYPADAGVVNVKTAYGAIGDGIKDDTPAILNAIRENCGTYALRNKIIYFPDGTYLVSDRLDWRSNKGNWCGYLVFQGESQENTVIKLQDRAPAYQDPGHPRAIVFTAAQTANPSEDVTHNPNGEGNAAFRNHLRDLTVDTGRGNSGAIGIDYLGNNNSVVKNVTIRSGDGSGKVGLSIARKYQGPLLVENVTVSGFETGLLVGHGYGTWFEHIRLLNQKSVGMTVTEGNVAIRDLQSTNEAVALQARNWTAVVTLIDSSFEGGSPLLSAIESHLDAKMFIRNVTSSGYRSLIALDGRPVPGKSQQEWTSKAAVNLFGSNRQSLNVPVKETPDYNDNNFSQWANVKAFGATSTAPRADSATAIQAAIDSGKSTVYFPWGRYSISKTIHVRGNVRRIIGVGAEIRPLNQNVSPAFQVDTTNFDDIFIEGLLLTANYEVAGQPRFGLPNFVYASPRTLILKESDSVAYSNSEGAGPAFVESLSFGAIVFRHQTAWIRNLNPEVNEQDHVTIEGGQVWILGLKTENPGWKDTPGRGSSIVATTGGAVAEILGIEVSIWHNIREDCPMVAIEDSQVSLSGVSTVNGYDYQVLAREKRGEVVRTLYSSRSPNVPKANPHGGSSAVPLYVAR